MLNYIAHLAVGRVHREFNGLYAAAREAQAAVHRFSRRSLAVLGRHLPPDVESPGIGRSATNHVAAVAAVGHACRCDVAVVSALVFS